MDRLIIDMDNVSGDYSIDYTNDGKGLNGEHILFAYVAIVKELVNMLEISTIDLIDLLCQLDRAGYNTNPTSEMMN